MSSIFGELERFFSETVYPDWPLFLALFVATAAIAIFLAVRMGWHVVAMEHRFITGAGVAVFLAVAIPAGYWTLSPLWERSTVCEASPLAGAGAGSEECEGDSLLLNPDDNEPGATGDATADPTAAPTDDVSEPTDAPAADDGGGFEAQVVKQGEFAGADDFHFGEGQALLIETAPGEYTLRFENFSVRNGPDLFVYLSPSPDGYADGALKLGGLKGTDGAFNYEVPPGTDVSQFHSAIVWCDAFSVLFATASFA